MAHHYSSLLCFTATFTTYFRFYCLPLILVVLNSPGWGQCFNPAIHTNAKSGTTAVGDFNGDGKLDFVTTQYDSDSIAIFLNTGNGAFNNGTRFFVGASPDSLAVGDLNLDGKLDVAVCIGRTSVAILLNDGKGGLLARNNVNMDSYEAIRVLISDFNMDGYPDLVATSLYNNVTVLLNDGHGGFGKRTKYSAGKSTQITHTKAGDFNGDGKPDLVLLQDNFGIYSVSLLLNNGVGGFTAPTFVRDNVLTGSTSIDVGDFNEDGSLDLVLAGDSLVVLLSNGRNGFTANRLQNPSGYSRYHYITVGDFNSDNKTDLAVSGYTEFSYVLLGKGNGFFNVPTAFSFQGNPSAGFLPGDFNADKQTDILAGQSRRTSILLNCTLTPKPTPNDSQTAIAGVPFAYTANAFTDAETPNSLTYSASFSPTNGLRIDPMTRLISGTPSLSGVTAVTVTATDPSGLSAATSFIITVKPPIILGITEPAASEFTLSPNPVTDIVQVSLNNAYRGVVSVWLLSSGGQSVRTHTAIKTSDTWQYSLSVLGLPTGSYYLSLYQTNQQLVGKLLKL